MAKARDKNSIQIECEIKKSYTVNFIDDLFAEDNAAFSDILRSLAQSETPNVLLVADQNVVQKTQSLGTRIGKYFQKYGVKMASAPVVLSGGEKNKSDNFQMRQLFFHTLLFAFFFLIIITDATPNPASTITPAIIPITVS